MNNPRRPALIASAMIVLMCDAGAAPRSDSQRVIRASGVDVVSMRQGRAAYRSLRAKGMVYHISGRVGNIKVTTVNGKLRVFATAMRGEAVRVEFVKGRHDVVDFNPIRPFARARRVMTMP